MRLLTTELNELLTFVQRKIISQSDPAVHKKFSLINIWLRKLKKFHSEPNQQKEFAAKLCGYFKLSSEKSEKLVLPIPRSKDKVEFEALSSQEKQALSGYTAFNKLKSFKAEIWQYSNDSKSLSNSTPDAVFATELSALSASSIADTKHSVTELFRDERRQTQNRRSSMLLISPFPPPFSPLSPESPTHRRIATDPIGLRNSKNILQDIYLLFIFFDQESTKDFNSSKAAEILQFFLFSLDKIRKKSSLYDFYWKKFYRECLQPLVNYFRSSIEETAVVRDSTTLAGSPIFILSPNKIEVLLKYSAFEKLLGIRNFFEFNEYVTKLLKISFSQNTSIAAKGDSKSSVKNYVWLIECCAVMLKTGQTLTKHDCQNLSEDILSTYQRTVPGESVEERYRKYINIIIIIIAKSETDFQGRSDIVAFLNLKFKTLIRPTGSVTAVTIIDYWKSKTDPTPEDYAEISTVLKESFSNLMLPIPKDQYLKKAFKVFIGNANRSLPAIPLPKNPDLKTCAKLETSHSKDIDKDPYLNKDEKLKITYQSIFLTHANTLEWMKISKLTEEKGYWVAIKRGEPRSNWLIDRLEERQTTLLRINLLTTVSPLDPQQELPHVDYCLGLLMQQLGEDYLKIDPDNAQRYLEKAEAHFIAAGRTNSHYPLVQDHIKQIMGQKIKHLPTFGVPKQIISQPLSSFPVILLDSVTRTANPPDPEKLDSSVPLSESRIPDMSKTLNPLQPGRHSHPAAEIVLKVVDPKPFSTQTLPTSKK